MCFWSLEMNMEIFLVMMWKAWWCCTTPHIWGFVRRKFLTTSTVSPMQTVKNDFYRLCNDFYLGAVSLDSTNTSYITLVPKINSPEIVSDYRPISLMNINLKLVTKILADHLQAVIVGLIHRNQYGFIRTRTKQDCLSNTSVPSV
jgi:hypothetical protein